MSAVDVFITLLLEAGFVVLPLLVHLVIVLEEGTPEAGKHFLASSEWSFASIVLFGRTLVWLSAATRAIPDSRMARLRLAQFAIIAAGLMPSILWLSKILGSETPSQRLITLQLMWFVVSLLSFLVLAGIGESRGAVGSVRGYSKQ